MTSATPLPSQLPKLRFLTPLLPEFPKDLGCQLGRDRSAVEYETEEGTTLSFPVFNRPEISAANWFNSKGSVFASHTHEQREWIIVYRGSMFLSILDEPEKHLTMGMSVVIEPGTVHSARFEEDCWCMAITVPRSEDWPA